MKRFPAVLGMPRNTEDYKGFWSLETGREFRAYRDGRTSILDRSENETFYTDLSVLPETERQILEFEVEEWNDCISE